MKLTNSIVHRFRARFISQRHSRSACVFPRIRQVNKWMAKASQFPPVGHHTDFAFSETVLQKSPVSRKKASAPRIARHP